MPSSTRRCSRRTSVLSSSSELGWSKGAVPTECQRKSGGSMARNPTGPALKSCDGEQETSASRIRGCSGECGVALPCGSAPRPAGVHPKVVSPPLLWKGLLRTGEGGAKGGRVGWRMVASCAADSSRPRSETRPAWASSSFRRPAVPASQLQPGADAARRSGAGQG